MRYFAGSYDVAVVGAGHAGIEAALAAARLGLRTIVFTINLDAVGNMPCNPAIGGTGKGHLVRELDALGGEMARAADACCIQYRMLNRGKGPAVHSLRAQADRRHYQEFMKHTLELQENLTLKQATVVELLTENGRVSGLVTQLGAEYRVRACVIAAGTYLDSRVITGEVSLPSGPDGLRPAPELTESLRALGLRLRRFKTGTPPRINAKTVDFSKMEPQPGDETPEPFSFSTEAPVENRAICYLTYTNSETHRIIRENLARSHAAGRDPCQIRGLFAAPAKADRGIHARGGAPAPARRGLQFHCRTAAGGAAEALPDPPALHRTGRTHLRRFALGHRGASDLA